MYMYMRNYTRMYTCINRPIYSKIIHEDIK